MVAADVMKFLGDALCHNSQEERIADTTLPVFHCGPNDYLSEAVDSP